MYICTIDNVKKRTVKGKRRGFTPNKAHRVLLCIGSGGLTRCAGGGENFEPDNGIVSRGCSSTITPGALCCV